MLNTRTKTKKKFLRLLQQLMNQGGGNMGVGNLVKSFDSQNRLELLFAVLNERYVNYSKNYYPLTCYYF